MSSLSDAGASLHLNSKIVQKAPETYGELLQLKSYHSDNFGRMIFAVDAAKVMAVVQSTLAKCNGPYTPDDIAFARELCDDDDDDDDGV
jgi:hypothetical protein